jgi:REP element-mobilizing transposase RayT
MARQERLISSTNIYHILLRGINRQRIFEKAEDYIQFLDFLYSVKKQSGFTLYAYCLMGNHIHLLIKEGEEPLSQIFRRLGTRYAQWFNKEYERVGSLFQNRFRSEPVETNEYFITVLVYIFQNPVKAGICRYPAEYEWGSRRFLGKTEGLIDESALFEICPASEIKQRERELVDEDLFSEPKIGRRAAYADKTVAFIIRQISGAENASDFQRLSRDGQKSAVKELRSNGVPIRQIARLPGLSNGVVGKWSKG